MKSDLVTAGAAMAALSELGFSEDAARHRVVAWAPQVRGQPGARAAPPSCCVCALLRSPQGAGHASGGNALGPRVAPRLRGPQVLALPREEIADLIRLWSKFGAGVDERPGC